MQNSKSYYSLKVVVLSKCKKHLLRTKSVHIWSVSGLHFRGFGLNTEGYSVFSPNARKYGLKKLPLRTLRTQWF